MTDVINILIKESGLSELDIRRIVNNAPERYKEYTIAKKNGGIRWIAHPAKELKVLQRALSRHILADFPVHQSAKAYINGMSIRDNASVHAGNRQILKMDFKDFFPSIQPKDWLQYCSDQKVNLTDDDLRITIQLLFHRPKSHHHLRLAIGAPSSPILSNILMYNFDKTITGLLEKDKILYTRYADDLTFSAPRTGFLNSVPKAMSDALSVISYPSLKINHSKTTRVTTKYRRTVTGLVLSNDGRVTIGRDSKRNLRAAIHNCLSGKLLPAERDKLRGLLGYVKSVEPEHYNLILNKFGAEQIIRILQNRI